jgi:hypothetical protein
MAEPPYSLDEFWNIVAKLGNDLRRCASALETAGNGEDFQEVLFWHRMCAHTVCAAIEGATYHMAYIAYVARNSRDVVFSLDELGVLETAYDFEEDREIEAGLTEEQMLERIKFAFNAFARVHYSDYVLPLNDPEWLQVKEIFSSKKRRTHPQTTTDLEVTEKEVTDLLEGTAWFMKCMVALLESSRECMEARVALWDGDRDELIM